MDQRETDLHRCSLCGALVPSTDARLVVSCGRHPEDDSPRWNTPFRIRPARVEDLEDVRRLAVGFWGHEDLVALDRTFPVLELDLLVADAGGAVAGFVGAHRDGETGLLVALAVPPLYQGLGVGSSLLSAAESRLAAAGARRVRLSTTNDNGPLLQMVQRRGYVVEEVLPGTIARALEERLGSVPAGFAGIPVRDEIRLVRDL